MDPHRKEWKLQLTLTEDTTREKQNKTPKNSKYQNSLYKLSSIIMLKIAQQGNKLESFQEFANPSSTSWNENYQIPPPTEVLKPPLRRKWLPRFTQSQRQSSEVYCHGQQESAGDFSRRASQQAPVSLNKSKSWKSMCSVWNLPYCPVNHRFSLLQGPESLSRPKGLLPVGSEDLECSTSSWGMEFLVLFPLQSFPCKWLNPLQMENFSLCSASLDFTFPHNVVKC